MAEKKSITLSTYAESLPSEPRDYYIEKLSSLGFQNDPYHDKFSSDDGWFIAIQAKKSCHSGESLLNSGWLVEGTLYQKNDLYLALGKVRHSQRLSVPPTNSWVCVRRDGQIIRAHCDCMAGLGEACSHVACLMKGLKDANTSLRESGESSCTSRACSWLPPKASQVKPMKIADINFSNPAKKFKHVQEDANVRMSSKNLAVPKHEFSTSVMKSFFEKLNSNTNEMKPAILRVLPEFYQNHVPATCTEGASQPLSQLYDDAFLKLSFQGLLSKCELIYKNLNITDKQCDKIEKATQAQNRSNLWFEYRCGRITASLMRAAIHTNPDKPSLSLLKKICYPHLQKFSNDATKWGCEHEQQARDAFLKSVASQHCNTRSLPVGLLINPQWPFIGATPDGVVECDCCGKSVLEIKCPYKCRDRIRQDTDDGEVEFGCSYLKVSNGVTKLDSNHSYYYQIQTQMNVMDVNRGYFVVWSENEIVTVVIARDSDFFQDCVTRSRRFFKCSVLPEIVGKWFTRLYDNNLQIE